MIILKIIFYSLVLFAVLAFFIFIFWLVSKPETFNNWWKNHIAEEVGPYDNRF